MIENSESDNGVAAANPTEVLRNPLDPIVNGSFETGDLTGWTVKELTPASNPSLPLSVHRAGVEYPAASFLAWPYFIVLDYFTSAPTDGQYAALNDFNGDDPVTSGTSQYVNRRELSQDITLPATTTTLRVRLPGGMGTVPVRQHSGSHLQRGHRAGRRRGDAVESDHPGRAG